MPNNRSWITAHVLPTMALVGVVLSLLLAPKLVLAQAAAPQVLGPSITARFTKEAIVLDGKLNEGCWENADIASDFVQYFPVENAAADYPTEIRITYDDRFLYVGITAAAPNPDFVVSTLRRDFSGTQNDNVTLLFDTFKDGTNAFAFGVTPFGVQREILVSQGGAVRDGFNITWDVKWRAESVRTDNGYTIEAAIPFTSFKFPEGSQHWRFRPYRWNMQTNEQTSWVRVPQNQLLANLAFAGDLYFDRPLGRSRTPAAIIPYVNGLASKDFTTDVNNNELLVGGDAKLSIGDGLALDLTVNPDFSQAEVDAIFTNLTRFEIILPEQRQFFIDNSDLFAAFGNTYNEARPFFSRRIGLTRDTAGDLIQNRILAGARLSGKLDENWRLGVLSVQTAADEANGVVSNNNFMAALQRKVAARSNIGAFLVNRQAFGNAGDALPAAERYNRVVGADYNLATADGRFLGRAYAHASFNGDGAAPGWSTQLQGAYRQEFWQYVFDLTHVGADFQADLGFVPRRDFVKLGNAYFRYLFPENRSIINRHTVRFLSINYWRPGLDWRYTDHSLSVNWATDFRNSATAVANLQHNFIYLANPFDPTRSDGVPLPENQGYAFVDANLEYTSSPTQLLTYGGSLSGGQYYSGNRAGASLQAAYRFQPWVRVGFEARYDALRLPEPHASADLWLLTPRIEVSFSRQLFWTTLAQYSNQRQTFGINSRLQWRFAQLSDLFLVYNDGYRTNAWAPNFRSINLKLSYWLNL